MFPLNFNKLRAFFDHFRMIRYAFITNESLQFKLRRRFFPGLLHIIYPVKMYLRKTSVRTLMIITSVKPSVFRCQKQILPFIFLCLFPIKEDADTTISKFTDAIKIKLLLIIVPIHLLGSERFVPVPFMQKCRI